MSRLPVVGVMGAVSRAFHETPGRRGLVIGVLPCIPGNSGDWRLGPKDGYPNRWVEIPIQTHLPSSGEQGGEPTSRNHVNVLTSDVIVAMPGGAGTLSEVELAVRYERPVIAFVELDQGIPGLPENVPVSDGLEGVQSFVMKHLGR